MHLSAIFKRPVGRNIEGVIKADDEASLKTEVEEFVVTREVERRLSDFLEAYNDYQGANGAWISGFFGSGKSHLLKMLALLLENRPIDGRRTLDLFMPKCEGNDILAAEIRRAVKIPSKSILFNIDQKAVLISKTQVDALLSVFVQVFDEMCGYYGKQGHIAQFEHDLDNRGQYEAFKQAYASIAGRDWAQGREQALLEAQHIAAAYMQVTGAPREASVGILQKYRDQYRMSIEDFAEQVATYVSRQGPDFRLNFFVDEVGQYIADNPKLMLNLQTIAESLATKCRGRAWVIVTSQDGLDDIVGEMSKQQGADFSKIMARFRTRMKLTSTNVDEVIQDRLLKKNDLGVTELGRLYNEQHNNFRTYFGFGEGTRSYGKYRDHDHFIKMYPFVPYQVELFQTAIIQLSEHNAFEGKHRSVGERSLLEVFQSSAKRLADEPVGRLATFDLLFDGIRTTLKANIQTQINAAERQLADAPLAAQVLKVLFLLKYVREFKATPHNLLVLMTDQFDADLTARANELQEALDRLEQGSYVLRNGDLYEYLTDQEKDVEQEIKNTEVETAAVAEELHKIIFDSILRGERKIRDENGRDFAFARKLDGVTYGQAAEVAIQVFSPFHEHAGNPAILRMQSMGRDELWVVLPASPRLMQDLLMYKRTEKYYRQSIGAAQEATVKRILNDRQSQNVERMASLRALVADLLLEATLIFSGNDLDVTSTDARTRLTRAFQEVVRRVYTNLDMLRGISYGQESLARLPAGAATPARRRGGEHQRAGTGSAVLRPGQLQQRAALDRAGRGEPVRTQTVWVGCLGCAVHAGEADRARQDRSTAGFESARGGRTGARAGSDTALRQRGSRTARRVYGEPGAEVEGVLRGLLRRPRHGHRGPAAGPRDQREVHRAGGRPQAAQGKCGRATRSSPSCRDRSRRWTGSSARRPTSTCWSCPARAMPCSTSRRRSSIPSAGSCRATSGRSTTRRAGISKRRRQTCRTSMAMKPSSLRAILDDPACCHGNRMTQAKALLDALRGKVDALVAAERAASIAKLDQWWGAIESSAEYGELTRRPAGRTEGVFRARAAGDRPADAGGGDPRHAPPL